MDDKVKLTKCQNHHYHRPLDTRAKWARPQAEWAQGLVGRLGLEAVQPESWFPCIYTRRKRLSQWRKLMEASPPSRPTTWLGHPTSS
jgi:hypothetical protein